jgi:malate synthase
MPLDQPAAIQTPTVLRSVPGVGQVLTGEALVFLAELQGRFGLRLHALMVARGRRQGQYNAGRLPDYRAETLDTRRGVWTADAIPQILQDRRVEISGPVDRKGMIAAFNSGANVYVADFEDSTAPSFGNIIAGLANLIDYRDGSLEAEGPEGPVRLGPNPAVLMVRPRGLHLQEANVLIAGQPVSAALFDFGMSIFHCGRALAAMGQGPFYYLPKLESLEEARFWTEVFLFTQDRMGLARGTIKATVLIETLTAAFEMDEIVWELREHICGLNCGRWDYVFSYIKTLSNHAAYVLPDRATLTMDGGFLAAYGARVVKVAHRRGIHAIGGMAAQVPSSQDRDANALALANAQAVQQHEVRMGNDGTWVATPDLVPIARAIFDEEMPGPNQIRVPRQYYRIEPEMLLRPHKGQITEAGVKDNISVAITYLARWLSGHGAVAINNLMEDASTVEICRAQVWQWIRHRADVMQENGAVRRLDAEWLGSLLQAEIVAILDRLGPNAFHRGHYASAARIFHDAVTAPQLPDFITVQAYALLNALE